MGTLRIVASNLSVPSIESRLVRSSIKNNLLVRDQIFSRATFVELLGVPEQTEHGMVTETHVKAGRGLKANGGGGPHSEVRRELISIGQAVSLFPAVISLFISSVT